MSIVSLSVALGLFGAGIIIGVAQSGPLKAPALPVSLKKSPAPARMAALRAPAPPPVIHLGTNLVFDPKVLAELKGKGKVTLKAPPGPGLYRTEPYHCLVLVPGSHPDDKSIIKQGDAEPPMLKVEPELQFKPWPPPKPLPKPSK